MACWCLVRNIQREFYQQLQLHQQFLCQNVHRHEYLSMPAYNMLLISQYLKNLAPHCKKQFLQLPLGGSLPTLLPNPLVFWEPTSTAEKQPQSNRPQIVAWWVEFQHALVFCRSLWQSMQPVVF